MRLLGCLFIVVSFVDIVQCDNKRAFSDGLKLVKRAAVAAAVQKPTTRTTHAPADNATVANTAHHEEEMHGEESELEAPAIFFITVTLVIGAIAQLLLHLVHQYITIPYPVFLLVLGFAYGITTSKHVGIASFTCVAATNPEVLLLVFLPILIFEAAVSMPTHLFQKLFPHMLIIGTIGMAICLVSTAYVSVGLFQSNYDYSNVGPDLLGDPDSPEETVTLYSHATDLHEATEHGIQQTAAPKSASNDEAAQSGNGDADYHLANQFPPLSEMLKNDDDSADHDVPRARRSATVESSHGAKVSNSSSELAHGGNDDDKWTIQVGLLFAAVISVTDPVAAVDLLRHCGSAKSLTIVLEGTSLLSEATGIVLFNIIARVIDPDTEVVASYETGYIFQVILGGPAWGLLMGFIVTQLISRMSNMWEAEAILIISAPYVTFWCADAVFHVSGALAVMVLGLYISSHRACMNPEVEDFIHKMWEILQLIADTLIFSIYGILISQIALRGVPADDWWKLLVVNIFILFIRGFSFCLLKPVLSSNGLGAKTFTWPHTGVLVWTGFRGAVTLALAAHAAEMPYLEHRPALAEKMVFHSAGVVSFTLLINATTLRMLLRFLGMLEMPLSKLIGLNMAFQHLQHVRRLDMDSMAMDKYMADADWKMVDTYTKADGHEFGLKQSDAKMVWASQYLNHAYHCEEANKEKCGEVTPQELAEMENIARLRLVKAKKTAYWKQFAEGTLSGKGVEHLDDLTDIVLHSDSGVISADDIRFYLENEQWTNFRRRFSSIQKWIDRRRSDIFESPIEPHRLVCFKIATSRWFDVLIYVVILLNCVETITDWSLTGTTTAETNTRVLFLYTNFTFMMLYTAEVLIKVVGFGWSGYWGHTWLSFNRLNLFILCVTYIDLIIDFVIVYSAVGNNIDAQTLSNVRIIRFFRLVRFGRAFRLLKPTVPYVVEFLDNRISAHLYYGYDIARAYVIGQEECSGLVSHIIGYTPLVLQFKTQIESDGKTIAKEIGLLNETRPDIATAVKTRQAARCILNYMIKCYQDFRRKGLLEEDDVEHLMHTVEEQLKKIRDLPYTVCVLGDRDRLWNVPWINGNKQVLEIVKSLFIEKSYEKNDIFLPIKSQPDGIFFVTSGVVSLEYSELFNDSVELGEVYNSDNMEISADYDLAFAHHMPVKIDYALAGTMLNVQSVLLDLPRRSQGKCETGVSALYMDAVSLFKAMGTVPALEDGLWRRICTSVALNIIIKSGTIMDYETLDEQKARLSRGAVRLVRPGVKIKGLDKFPETYLISGSVFIPGGRRKTIVHIHRDNPSQRSVLSPVLSQGTKPISSRLSKSSKHSKTSKDSAALVPRNVTSRHSDIPGETLHAPRRLHASIQEIEIHKGRNAVVDETGWTIYPEYAVLLLIPPGEHDLSTINIHDSQLFSAEPEPQHHLGHIESHERRDAVLATSAHSEKTHETHQDTPHQRHQSDVGEIVTIVKQEERRRSRLSYTAFMQHRRFSQV
ncbi:sodium/hydrogen exchanger 10-like [Paramacrobiotus metropolitanus]|uniref:sodium/hydrogen exchanger 10-like n=1 Tax=Paramacrobiotus metropolitanus TaxID=2943436 RepID=UPI0024456C5A|nr:sodium/hydrogen exchanger 10-like [Paramacrobiotus metropolitanus]XP_055341118.1 sodium/hydrogen exchanger 10-like [Paramacrobiotus metropolitanus]XP_055341120.1 sodium/hydrogen exchanger 10-like [Paramacrobiotus metropolitanus]XP_055341121.1 sodium/hydrogen exchanger 10-like [Paramacrobiotus metropolitanus]XP_055341122.1 sodium/hydrogen exchanger 10-like [Paramacrobiotus metropolitanus]